MTIHPNDDSGSSEEPRSQKPSEEPQPQRAGRRAPGSPAANNRRRGDERRDSEAQLARRQVLCWTIGRVIFHRIQHFHVFGANPVLGDVNNKRMSFSP